MEILLYTMVGVFSIFYIFGAIKYYRHHYKGKFVSELYSNFIEFYFKFKTRNDCSESSYLKNRIGHHKIIFNSYLNEKYKPIHDFVTIIHSKGILVCYNMTSVGEFTGKDSDKKIVIKKEDKLVRIEGTKDVVEKHVNNIKKNNPDLRFEPTVCYFFKKDANFEKFKTEKQKAYYKDIINVLEGQTDMLSEAAILEVYDNCTSHLEKRKK